MQLQFELIFKEILMRLHVKFIHFQDHFDGLADVLDSSWEFRCVDSFTSQYGTRYPINHGYLEMQTIQFGFFELVAHRPVFSQHTIPYNFLFAADGEVTTWYFVCVYAERALRSLMPPTLTQKEVGSKENLGNFN
jgi:hypothetical protein